MALVTMLLEDRQNLLVEGRLDRLVAIGGSLLGDKLYRHQPGQYQRQ